jgi:hypothetical protein
MVLKVLFLVIPLVFGYLIINKDTMISLQEEVEGEEMEEEKERISMVVVEDILRRITSLEERTVNLKAEDILPNLRIVILFQHPLNGHHFIQDLW